MPDQFGHGISIPLLKDKSGIVNDIDNYRAITLLPVISQVLEDVIFSLCDNVLCLCDNVCDNVLCGFKSGIGCPDAVFALKSVINHFVDTGSCIFIASLDVSKAFDRVDHCKLFNALHDAEVSIAVVELLCNWYAIMFVVIRWNNSLWLFAVKSGVRQHIVALYLLRLYECFYRQSKIA